jgi:peptide/nickel transport system substrate-binding protein
MAPMAQRPAGLSRRDVFRIGAAAALGVGGIGAAAGCGAVPERPDPNAPQKRGGTFSHGATGGGLEDTVDPHFPVTNPDIARVNNLYEPLLFWNENYKIEPALATAVTPNADATEWIVKLRKGVIFHHGKEMTADDVLFTLARVTDPKNTAPGGTELVKILDLKNSTALDPYTIRLPLKSPYAVLDQLLAEYSVGIIPTDFDLKNPVGTGAFKYEAFLPAQYSNFSRHEDYWGQPAWVDELIIYDFADDAAKVNALLAGQVQSIDNLPTYLVDSIGEQGSSPLIADTGAWVPFTMRVDTGVYQDVRVREALRLVVDRQQMIDQALGGYGFLGNDLYSPFDPAYNDQLPQREQDVDQAKSLLQQAGRSDLQIELVTSTAVGAGGVESANLFVEHAKRAGIDCQLTKADPNVFYGDQYLQWPFAQDFWNTRNYIPQVAQCAQKNSPYNETHFDNPDFNRLIDEARREPDDARRTQLLHDAQEIEYETGGYIIWGFKRQVDGYSNLVQGFVPHRYLPCGSFKFQRVSFV